MTILASSRTGTCLVICGNHLKVNAQRSSTDKKANVPQATVDILDPGGPKQGREVAMTIHVMLSIKCYAQAG